MAGEREPDKSAPGPAERPAPGADAEADFGVISERMVPSSRDVPPSSRKPPPRSSAAPPADSDGARENANEEFLFHLYRGSELLQDNRVHEAKEELERALDLQPRDPQGQDLLAVVYFRLGMYPRAIAILERLKAVSPREPALLLSLSLCYLKTGQAERARDDLETLVAINPAHARAWGYLGLAYEKLGDAARAHKAFERGGHAGMAKRMKERASRIPPSDESSPSREVRDVVAAAYADLDSGAIGFEVAAQRDAADRPEGDWRPVELGAPRVTKKPDTRDGPAQPSPSITMPRLGPLPPGTPRRPTLVVAPPPADDPLPAIGSAPVPSFTLGAPTAVTSPPAMTKPSPRPPPPPSRSAIPPILPPPSAAPPALSREQARERSVPPPTAARLVDETALPVPKEGDVLLHPSGLALVHLGPRGFAARVESIRATASNANVRPLERRASGRTTGESFGGVASPVARVDGDGVLLLGPRPNRHLRSFLLEDELAFVREEVLVGFSAELEYENGRVSTGEGQWVAVVQLRGRGAVLTEVHGEVLSLRVTSQRGMIVRKEALLGWLGRLVPRALPPNESPAGQRGLLAFAGDGTLMLAGA